MVLKRGNPGCPCCDECKCLIDSFTDAVDVTDKDSKTIRPTLHPQHPYPAWLRAEIELDPGNVARLYFAWDDSDPGDGFYIEITPQDGTTKGTLKLFRKGGTQIGDTLELLCALPNPDGYYSTDLWHRVTACYDPDEDEVKVIFDAADERGWIIQNQELAAAVPSGFTAGRQAGYGTGSGHTGKVSFRNYRFERLWYCDDENNCTDDCPSDYYYEQQRTVCRTCGGCTIVDEDFSDLPDGDMPCGWDAAGTNWQIVNEEATGDGDILHQLDLAGTYIVTATFRIGAIEHDGDFAVVGIVGGPSAKIERISATCYLIAYTDADRQDEFVATRPASLQLSHCPVSESYYGTSTGVTITQPTGVSSQSSTLTAFEISKHKDMDPLCPDCADALPCIETSATFPTIGPMPCGWDVGATDWEVIETGKASGSGTVTYKIENDNENCIEADFTFAEMDTVGDFTTLILGGDDVTDVAYGVTIEVVELSGTKYYSVSWLPVTTPPLGSQVLVFATNRKLTLKRYPSVACTDGYSNWFSNNGTMELSGIIGQIQVSITQPTVSLDVSVLTELRITQTQAVNSECPPCNCTITCQNTPRPAFLYVGVPAYLDVNTDYRYGTMTQCTLCDEVGGVYEVFNNSGCTWWFQDHRCSIYSWLFGWEFWKWEIRVDLEYAPSTTKWRWKALLLLCHGGASFDCFFGSRRHWYQTDWLDDADLPTGGMALQWYLTEGFIDAVVPCRDQDSPPSSLTLASSASEL